MPVVLLAGFAIYCTQKLVRAHVNPEEQAPRYEFTRQLIARRGSIYSASGETYPFVKSVPFWEYRLDPVALTNIVKRRGERPPTNDEVLTTIANTLKLDRRRLAEMASVKSGRGYRSQLLKLSADPEVHRTLADSKLVRGVAIHDKQVRQYLHGRRLCHVLGSIGATKEVDETGTSGIELRFNRELSGTPGTIRGMRDARGNELYDKRTVSIDPIPGADVYLTIDPNIQYEAEEAFKWGLREFGAESGWGLVMDSQTGAILAEVSFPDFEPLNFGHTPESVKLNRPIGFNYEPGSVMKVVTLAAAIDAGFVSPNTVYRTNRDDPRYYRLPGDGSHVWEPTMTLKDAIVHSSNIVIGKLAYDFGPKRLWSYMRRFGFGLRTGIELPGEQRGILPNPHKKMWDKASWSRAGIGQFVAVTAVQLASAYQSIANDGVRMRPHIVDRVVAADGNELYRHVNVPMSHPISAKTARTMRAVMLDVASPKGTARRAAIRGYSVAGKTGTAQKQIPGGKGYYQGLYRASFCGILPATAPRLVVLVTLDFERRTKFHQGGNSAGPVFKRIALAAIRYLGIQPDRPEELSEFSDDDEFDRIMDERAQKYGAPIED